NFLNVYSNYNPKLLFIKYYTQFSLRTLFLAIGDGYLFFVLQPKVYLFLYIPNPSRPYISERKRCLCCLYRTISMYRPKFVFEMSLHSTMTSRTRKLRVPQAPPLSHRALNYLAWSSNVLFTSRFILAILLINQVEKGT
ncbi:hypothetical protein L9F63_002340, partial [Diploptera punctata]